MFSPPVPLSAAPTTPKYTQGPTLAEVQQGAEARRGQQDPPGGTVIQRAQVGLNQALNLNPPLATDHQLGPKTEAAIREFQRRAGLPQTGGVNADTLKALEKGPVGWRPVVSQATGTARASSQLGTRTNSVAVAVGQENAPAPAGSFKAGAMRAPPAAYDGSADAAALHEAMKGGLTGLTTDEEAIHRTLEGKTPAQISAIRVAYQEHYGEDLDASLCDELSGADLSRAQAAMRGDSAAAVATGIFQAIDGAGTDPDAIFAALEGKTRLDTSAIEKSYQQQYGKNGNTLRSDLKGDLSGDDLIRAEALLDGNRPRAEAARLHAALDGAGTDTQTVFKALESMSPSQRAATEQAYLAEYGHQLADDLDDDFSGPELLRATSAASADPGRISQGIAARLHAALDGIDVDETEVLAALEGLTPEQRAGAAAEYKNVYGVELKTALDGALSGDDLDLALTLLDHGKLSDAQLLHQAMAGAGTNEEQIRRVLEGKSRPEIASIEADYLTRYGTSLHGDLNSETSGRDAFDVSVLLKGKVDTGTTAGLREAVSRQTDARDFERGGLLNTAGRVLVDAFGSSGKTLDRNTTGAEQALEAALADGTVSADERAKIERVVGFGGQDLGAYRTAKDSASETVGTVASTAAAIALTAGTAGMGAPLAVGMLIGAAGAGSTKALTSAAIQGGATTLEGLGTSAATGAIDGASFAFGGAIAEKAAQKGVEYAARNAVKKYGAKYAEEVAVEMLAGGAGDAAIAAARQNAVKSVVNDRVLELAKAEIGLKISSTRNMAIAGAADGAASGAASSGTGTALDDRTWSDGVASGLKRVAASSALGGTVGAALGAAGGLAEAIKLKAVPIDESKVWIPYASGRRDFGSFDDMVNVNRAQEPTPHKVTLLVRGKPAQVAVFGARSAREVNALDVATYNLSDMIGPDLTSRAVKNLHLRDRLGVTPINVKGDLDSIGGLANMRQPGDIVLQRALLSDPEKLQAVFDHEVGHSIDALLGKISSRPGSPFGKGQSVSDYAELDPLEDFAETFSYLTKNWKEIHADPVRYIVQNGDVGQKIKYILEALPRK